MRVCQIGLFAKPLIFSLLVHILWVVIRCLNDIVSADFREDIFRVRMLVQTDVEDTAWLLHLMHLTGHARLAQHRATLAGLHCAAYCLVHRLLLLILLLVKVEVVGLLRS